MQELQALKFHPREDTENRFILRWAERVYQEVPVSERRFLESLIQGFEEALELQDKGAIEANRNELKSLLERFGDGYENNDEQRDWGP